MRTNETPRTEQGRLLATLERLLTIKALEVKRALDEASTLVAKAVGADKADAFMHDPATETLVAMGTSDTPLGHTEDDPEELLGIKQGLGVRSTIAAAIEIDGERRGVLALTSAQPERFSCEDLRFCEAVARWVGLVAHRAALVERVTREAAEQARRVAADALIEMLAHDLRTPLTPAISYLSLLRREVHQAGRPRAVRYADQVAVALKRVQRMIGAILDASRLEQGLFELAPQPVDLATLVRETAETLGTPQTPLHIAAPADLVVERADPERLRQGLG